MRKLARRSLLRWTPLGVLGLFGIITARPVYHLAREELEEDVAPETIPDGFADDASRLNLAPIRRRVPISGATPQAELQIADALAEARQSGAHVAIAGARHTMGGQTIFPDGVVLDMTDFRAMTLDAAKRLLTVQAGALWSQIIPFLDAHGLSVAVMQSNNDFSVGGTLGANAHGWQAGHPPIASTVESFRIVLADGTAMHCDPAQNAELFSLALGGYGLFGVMTDVVLRVVPNQIYEVRHIRADTAALAGRFFQELQTGKEPGLAFARLSVSRDALLDHGLIYHFVAADGDPAPLTKIAPENGTISHLRRLVFRGSQGSDYGKALRWDVENLFSEKFGKNRFTRNELLNTSVENILDRSAATTDILHEYFVPPEQLDVFTRALARTVREQGADLLNVTIRDVRKDELSFLRYARADSLSLVLLFSQMRDGQGEARMRKLTERLIDEVLRVGGCYYLPYRLHATVAQFHAAYPMAKEFFQLKVKYDPERIFQNEFYLRYGA